MTSSNSVLHYCLRATRSRLTARSDHDSPASPVSVLELPRSDSETLDLDSSDGTSVISDSQSSEEGFARSILNFLDLDESDDQGDEAYHEINDSESSRGTQGSRFSSDDTDAENSDYEEDSLSIESGRRPRVAARDDVLTDRFWEIEAIIEKQPKASESGSECQGDLYLIQWKDTWLSQQDLKLARKTYFIADLLEDRVVQHQDGLGTEYLVRWELTWLTRDVLIDAEDLIERFENEPSHI